MTCSSVLCNHADPCRLAEAYPIAAADAFASIAIAERARPGVGVGIGALRERDQYHVFIVVGVILPLFSVNLIFPVFVCDEGLFERDADPTGGESGSE